jgi:hypothetical protein
MLASPQEIRIDVEVDIEQTGHAAPDDRHTLLRK